MIALLINFHVILNHHSRNFYSLFSPFLHLIFQTSYWSLGILQVSYRFPLVLIGPLYRHWSFFSPFETRKFKSLTLHPPLHLLEVKENLQFAKTSHTFICYFVWCQTFKFDFMTKIKCTSTYQSCKSVKYIFHHIFPLFHILNLVLNMFPSLISRGEEFSTKYLIFINCDIQQNGF